jgi:hypothetical protein
MESQSIIFQGAAFGYGPASIAIAIAEEVRHQFPSFTGRLIALGGGTSYELFSSSGVFDKCHRLESYAEASCPSFLKKEIRDANVVISVIDPDFANLVWRLGHKPVFIDPLLWMWKSEPISVSSCKRYYAMNFPGVAEKLSAIKARSNSSVLPIVVDPVLDNLTLARVGSTPMKNTLLLNFGGMQYPMGSNIELVLTMSRIIIDLVLNYNLYDAVLICGGGNAIKELERHFQGMDRRIRVRSVPQTPCEFLSELASCRTLITVPGLSIAFEALYLQKVTLFILPLNYTQHLQGLTYKKVLKNAYFVSWDDLPGYHTLPNGLPEEKGIEECFRLGRQFSSDATAQSTFRQLLLNFLQISSPKKLSHSEFSYPLSFGGAMQIARDIVALARSHD